MTKNEIEQVVEDLIQLAKDFAASDGADAINEPEIQRGFELINQLRKQRQWYKPSQRPLYSPDAIEISLTVLLYDPAYKMHALGWFNFDKEEWSTFEEFYLDNDEWKWTYLPIPE